MKGPIQSIFPNMKIPTINDIRTAHQRIKPFVHRTPVITSQTLNIISQKNIFLKCESFQKSGAFKIRGATNAVQALPEEVA